MVKLYNGGTYLINGNTLIEKNDIKKFYTSKKLEKNIYIYIYSEVCYESGNLKKRKMQRENKSKDVEYSEIGEVVKKYN